MKPPACSACCAVVKWRVRLFDHAAGVTRVAQLCGRHVRPIAEGPRVTPAYTVLEIVKIEYTIGWD